jgi:hypothetical protein
VRERRLRKRCNGGGLILAHEKDRVGKKGEAKGEVVVKDSEGLV